MPGRFKQRLSILNLVCCVLLTRNLADTCVHGCTYRIGSRVPRYGRTCTQQIYTGISRERYSCRGGQRCTSSTHGTSTQVHTVDLPWLRAGTSYHTRVPVLQSSRVINCYLLNLVLSHPSGRTGSSLPNRRLGIMHFGVRAPFSEFGIRNLVERSTKFSTKYMYLVDLDLPRCTQPCLLECHVCTHSRHSCTF